MKKLILTTAMAVILPLSANAQDNELVSYKELPAGNYSLDKTHASLIWEVSHMGLADYTARFTNFDVDINYNPENPSASTVTAKIDPLSLKTDYPYPEQEDFDKKLSEGEDWLNAGEYPEITFTSTSLVIDEDNEGTLTGDLTFMGVTKPVTLDVEFNGGYLKKPHAGVPAMGFSAEGVIKRSEWGFDTYVPMIGDEVEIEIEAEFHQDQPEEAEAGDAS